MAKVTLEQGADASGANTGARPSRIRAATGLRSRRRAGSDRGHVTGIDRRSPTCSDQVGAASRVQGTLRRLRTTGGSRIIRREGGGDRIDGEHVEEQEAEQDQGGQ